MADCLAFNGLMLDFTGRMETAPDLSCAELCHAILDLDNNYDRALDAASSLLRTHDEQYEATDPVGGQAPLPALPFTGAVFAASLLSHAVSESHLDVGQEAGLDAGRYLLEQFAPQALLSGCVLQNFADAANNHEPIPALMHAVHSWQVGAGRIEHNHANQYRQLLESAGMYLPDIAAPGFNDSADFDAAAWALPAYRLSLSIFPRSRRAEAIGAAFFDIVAGIDQLSLPSAIAPLVHSSGYYKLRTGATRQAVLANIAAVIDQEAVTRAEGDMAIAGVAKGFMTSLALYGAHLQQLASHIGAGAQQPTSAMVRLIEKKAKHAVGYHSKLKIGGTGFEQLIVGDAAEFVDALGRSRWVKPGDPGASLLLTKLIQFGGAMYRVFSDDETAIIAAWITSLGSDTHATTTPARALGCPVRTEPSNPIVIKRGAMAVRQARGQLCERELYYRLLNDEACGTLRAEALHHVETWFARSTARMARQRDSMPFDSYSHAALTAWFDSESIGQLRSYVETPVTKQRSEVIDDALQLCPMIFIDGAWLQKWGNAGLVEGRVGAILYKIFSDEIGNGNVVENHPNIYRALIREMGVELPDFRSRDFAFAELFDDRAFAVPAFWLSLSQFPTRFLPETLGINLAMELSGVGNSYRTACRELKHHGFSTLFVELHNTIDNVSSGHSAMAIDAIKHHMDDVMALRDPGLVERHWRRVWTGYRSLSKPEKSWMEYFKKAQYPLNRTQLNRTF